MNKSSILKNVVCSLIILIAICVVCLKSSFAAQYEYDKLNRVTKVTYGDGSYVEYTYDANGNIKSVKKVDGTPKQEEDVTTKPDDDSNTNPDSDYDDNKVNESDKESSDNKDSNKEDVKENDKEGELDKNPSNNVENKKDKEDKKPSNNVENKKDKEDKKEKKDKGKSKNKLNIFKPGSSHNTNPRYDSEFGIVYPKTIEEYLEEYMWFYDVVVKPSPMSKFEWVEYTYTLYFAQQDGVVDEDERKEFKKILDKFEANKFYRDYIRFKEKLYALIKDEQ